MNIERVHIKWLAKKLSHGKCNHEEERVDLVLANEHMLLFLAVWALFEQKLSTKGFLKSEDVKRIAKEYCAHYSTCHLENIFQYFFNRYQEQNLMLSLANKQKYENVDSDICSIIEKEYIKLSEQDKMHLLIYVVYRFRNNIFHGNKKILAWEQYTEQIDYCVRIMMAIIDAKDGACE